ncbi:hypothetical protein CWC31_00215 [Pseudoalteromonas ruthenica]|uniref:hypothetical protein n=1 Tax=Pseudoalteromonas ruthenica TaxID=151081 RepID=UPI00110948C0|nr:hypothetical protein [Pseudoalteromonas ruthenica]TLX52616.1 hypothetical protein CWC31_00215 [Pseudoalteromonas ruthenica]
MDKIAELQADLKSLEEALSCGDYGEAVKYHSKLDKKLRGLSEQEVAGNQDLLADIYNKLTSLNKSARETQLTVKKDLSNFTKNQSKLKAYDIPR